MALDLVVAGGGISGLSLAWAAARSGRRVALLEKSRRPGGCIYSHRQDDFWFEMGAHTVYNSYGGFLELAEASGATGKLLPRGPARVHFGLLKDGTTRWLTPPRVLLQLNWLRAALRFPVGIFRRKRGKTVQDYYTGLLGRKNFQSVLSPFFAAVPSQRADGFPVSGPGSLFKKRPRRKDHPRSFGFEGGLQTVCDALVEIPEITVQDGAEVVDLAREPGGFRVGCRDGRSFRAPQVALALPVPHAAALLAGEYPELSASLKPIATVRVESLGLALPREKCWMPECAFVVPVEDKFYSMVTRDPFPHPDLRAFCFHFRGGVPRGEKIDRAAQVLRLAPGDLGDPVEHQVTLPAPALDHHRIVTGIDRQLAREHLALTGNYFNGLAIEDCVQRSLTEWKRLSALVKQAS